MAERLDGEKQSPISTTLEASSPLRLRLAIHGAVQGVGFRPFVYRLASEMELNGWVVNSPQGVLIEVEGERAALEVFTARLEREKPSLSHIQGMETSYLDPVGLTKFEIRESDHAGKKSALVLPDIATCPECLSEIFDPGNRRYLYPFTNCTNCGPRFSIIKTLPYDRPNTTMAQFEMCEECRTEYEDPLNRRFHAQPNACPKCGPHLELWDAGGKVLATHNDALLQAADAVRAGKILALKGIGGFQLLVDAANEASMKLLRARKHREGKPFAIMFPNIGAAMLKCEVSEMERRLLLSPESPIVLLRRKKASIADRGPRGSMVVLSVAPRNPYLGVVLPYAPLHHLLMHELGFPVVATSGNLSEEPICTNEYEALQRLAGIADMFLVHDRPIERQVDDSVVRVMMGRVQVVRRARGYAPFPVELHVRRDGLAEDNTRSVLAVGGHLKNTVALTSGSNVFISQHIGDLSTPEAYQAFEKVLADLQNLFEITPDIVAHDLHPDYLSTQFAGKSQAAGFGVQHHFAHVAACIAENEIEDEVLGVSWDGTGYGEDGLIWGGEFLVTDGSKYRRAASFRPFRLPGSTASIKEPRRTAVGLLYEIFGKEALAMRDLLPVCAFDDRLLSIIGRMLESGINSPLTTSAGRLFDAVSSLTGLRQTVSFEGQGAMDLEFALEGVSCEEAYPYTIRTKSAASYYEAERDIDWEPMIRKIIADARSGLPAGIISAKFHNALTEVILSVANETAKQKVVLSGGCFQNRYLTERTIRLLTKHNFRVYWHQRVPPNDGGISLGQAFAALMRSRNPGTNGSGSQERNSPGSGAGVECYEIHR